ncbi:hypothetical protein [Chitinophaga eiseniae]|uniref:hypothetical protein n=1 Tax=Chitinophaga eiseniae TaxID=634771 RepID=UPI001177BA38|nr:hypothetical protein [Chitinophaga eiseniae]
MLTPFEGQGVSVRVGQQWWPPVLRTGVLPAPAVVGTVMVSTPADRRSKQVLLTRCFDQHRVSVLVRK